MVALTHSKTCIICRNSHLISSTNRKLQASARLCKATMLGCFSWFLNYTNGTKSRWASQVIEKLKPATLIEVTLPLGCSSCLLNYLNGTASRWASQIIKNLKPATVLKVTLLRCLFMFFKLYKCYQIGLIITRNSKAEACNFTKSNTPSWVFFMFFKLYSWYQITLVITNNWKYLHERLET